MINNYDQRNTTAAPNQTYSGQLSKQGGSTLAPPSCPSPDRDLLASAVQLIDSTVALGRALDAIQNNLFFNSPSAEGENGCEIGAVASINDLINIACTRVACMTGFARTINSRLVGFDTAQNQL